MAQCANWRSTCIFGPTLRPEIKQLAKKPELTWEESSWLLAIAQGRLGRDHGEIGMPDAVQVALFAKGCITLGPPVHLTPFGIQTVALGPGCEPEEVSGSPTHVFLVKADLPTREPTDSDSSTGSPPAPEPA